MFDQVWNPTTRTCRGLIINSETYEVVARPFAKFFNYGEDKADKIGLDEMVTVSDKMDGSLGIMYWQPRAKQWAIATRGSFMSDQAVWATDWVQKYADPEYFSRDYTYLYEILASWNRIVLEYTWEGLVLLAIQDMNGNRIDLPEDPRLLSAGSTQNDSREH
jgi:RNA ligase